MKAHLVGPLAVLCSLAGCGISDPKDLRTFTFAIRERPDLSWTQVPIELIVTTETQSPCLSHALRGDVGFGQDVVAVALSSIELPRDVCIPSEGPAEFSNPIGFGPVSLGNPFYLTFQRGGEVDRYLVIVSETAIDIAPLRSGFTHPTDRRVPRGS